MEETKKINKIILDYDGNTYEFDGGGGGGGRITPGVPIPENTVNSDSIIDGSVEMEDLNEDVKSKIQKTYDEDDETLHMEFDEADVNNSNN